MFDLIFSNAQAYQQVGLFFGALLCFGIGALLLGNSIYWHLRGLRVTGTIIGVVNQGGTYAPVYRYTSADGSVHEARSAIGSTTVAGKETGRVVSLLVSPHDPARAQEAGIGSIEMMIVAAGVLFAAAGVWMGSTAITAYPVTAQTWIMAAFMTLYGLWHLRRSIVFKSQPGFSSEAWRGMPGNGASVGIAGVQPIEQIVSSADAQRADQNTSQQRKWAAPFVLLFAVIFACVAVYQAVTLARLESVGLRAEGQVVRLKSEYNSSSRGSSYSYYPIVRYRIPPNLTLEFKDSIGSNPPSYRVGDKVTVLYLPDSSRTQMIDRGLFWNWALPAAIGAGALFLFWLFYFLRRAGSQSSAIGDVTPRTMRFSI